MKRALVLLCLFFLSPNAQSAPEKEWTFLLFLNGHNNLDIYGDLNLNQLERVGSNDGLNLVVQWASMRNVITKRLLIQKDEDFETVTSPVVQELPRVDMGNYRNLEEFIRWGIEKYPAKHYFVTVWNHGSGWRNFILNDFYVNDISFDDITQNAISTKELGLVMQNVAASLGRKIDIYGSDACLMGMVEIAAEMAGAIDYFIGSQYLEPLAGWPYVEVFAPLALNPQMSPKDFSIHLADAFLKSYSEGGSNELKDVTMSALDMGKYLELEQAVKELSVHIQTLPAISLEQINRIAWATQNFHYWFYLDYIDLGDFLKRLFEGNVENLNLALVQKTHNAMKDFVVTARNSNYFRDAQGVSIWVPKDPQTLGHFIELYRDLRFDKETSWSRAISGFVGRPL